MFLVSWSLSVMLLTHFALCVFVYVHACMYMLYDTFSHWSLMAEHNFAIDFPLCVCKSPSSRATVMNNTIGSYIVHFQLPIHCFCHNTKPISIPGPGSICSYWLGFKRKGFPTVTTAQAKRMSVLGSFTCYLGLWWHPPIIRGHPDQQITLSLRVMLENTYFG